MHLAAISSAWLLTEKIFVLGITFLITVLLARHLGPDDFGALNYAMAVVAIVSAFTTLGLGGGVVVRELVRNPAEAAEIVGTTLAVRIAASTLGLAATVIFAWLVGLDQQDLIFLIALSLPFDAAITFRLLFEARVASMEVAIATVAATILGASLRLVAIYYQAPLWIFAAIIPLQAAITATALAIIFSRFGSAIMQLRCTASRARRLLHESWPLMISSAGAILYLKLDQFMLGEMAGMSVVGTYSVASRLSEVWYILPTIVGASIAPRIFELHATNCALYERRLKQAFGYSFWLGVLVAASVSIVATKLIVALYGRPYAPAGLVLSIHIWTCPAVFMGVILQKWFLAERLILHSFWRHLLGAAVNIGLNLLLIPIWGGVGAAVATLVSYTVASFLSCFIGKRTVRAGFLMLEAILSPQLLLPSRKASS
jgi:O-antigen/teichoic acid export membrane protein